MRSVWTDRLRNERSEADLFPPVEPVPQES